MIGKCGHSKLIAFLIFFSSKVCTNILNLTVFRFVFIISKYSGEKHVSDRFDIFKVSRHSSTKISVIMSL